MILLVRVTLHYSVIKDTSLKTYRKHNVTAKTLFSFNLVLVHFPFNFMY